MSIRHRAHFIATEERKIKMSIRHRAHFTATEERKIKMSIRHSRTGHTSPRQMNEKLKCRSGTGHTHFTATNERKIKCRSGEGHTSPRQMNEKLKCRSGEGHTSPRQMNEKLKCRSGEGHTSPRQMIEKLKCRSGTGHTSPRQKNEKLKCWSGTGHTSPRQMNEKLKCRSGTGHTSPRQMNEKLKCRSGAGHICRTTVFNWLIILNNVEVNIARTFEFVFPSFVRIGCGLGNLPLLEPLWPLPCSVSNAIFWPSIKYVTLQRGRALRKNVRTPQNFCGQNSYWSLQTAQWTELMFVWNIFNWQFDYFKISVSTIGLHQIDRSEVRNSKIKFWVGTPIPRSFSGFALDSGSAWFRPPPQFLTRGCALDWLSSLSSSSPICPLYFQYSREL